MSARLEKTVVADDSAETVLLGAGGQLCREKPQSLEDTTRVLLTHVARVASWPPI